MPFNSYRLNHLLQLFILFILVFNSRLVNAQVDTNRGIIDTIFSPATLQHVKITAFEHNRILKDVPAAVNYIGQSNLQRFGSSSLVQAINASAGIRMEERSPGSYRINIRGSSLRSPFGVRNVKVYYNDIPLTDPGGNTYLNQLGYYNFNSIEVIKGPGSSLYGPGTGGVLLIESLNAYEQAGLVTAYSAGSYGLQSIFGSLGTVTERSVNRFSVQHMKSDGYRDHSELKRDVYSWNGLYRLHGNQVIKTSFIYGDLFYETPGALNNTEYDNNPRVARPGGGGFPGAVDARAAIHQTTFLAGASMEQSLLSWLKNKTVLYGVFTELVNPNLRGFEKSSMPHAGGRTNFRFHKKLDLSDLSIDAGGEWQKGFQTIHVHNNVDGNAGSLRTLDEINNRQALIFAQAVLDLHSGWTFVSGASINWYKTEFGRFSASTNDNITLRFVNEIAPRAAIMKKLRNMSFYTGVSKGFSPPTITEIIPTGGIVNLALNAEDGINHDAGFRASLENRLTMDGNLFWFRLNNTIVQRRDAGGGDYFINAGKTSQKGIELALTYPLLSNHSGIDQSLAWVSYTFHHFKYVEFRQLSNDFSGNMLPGNAKHSLAAGWDLIIQKKWDLHLHYLFSGPIALNDANSMYAEDYHLLGMKLGYFFNAGKKMNFHFSAGTENLLDEKYSLGNDINGFGGRYFNAAPGRNFYVGIRMQLLSKNRIADN